MPYNENRQRSEPIIIVGAGISGLIAAIALARQGWRSQILESHNIMSEAGAGIQLSPNAMHIMHELEISSYLSPHATKSEAVEIYDGISSEPLTTLPLGSEALSRYGAPYYSIHRGDLQTALVSAAANYPEISLTTGFKVKTIQEADDILMVRDEKDSNTVYGAALIAADGIWSGTRKNLFASDNLIYTGKTASRALVPAANIPKSFSLERTRIWLAPNAHLVHYPVNGGLKLNVVAIIDEKHSSHGWNSKQNSEVVNNAFRLWSNDVRDFVNSIDDWRKWSLAELPVLQRWSTGKILLIGDAAHPVLPFLAQGGGLAIEDGFEVALCLAHSKGQYEEAWQLFYQQRIKRVQAIQLASRRNGEIYHLGRQLGWSRNLFLKLFGGHRLMKKYDWIYSYRSDLA